MNRPTRDGNGLREYALLAREALECSDYAARIGNTNWSGLLLCTVYGAIAETDPAKLQAQLAEARDVIRDWIDSLDIQAGPVPEM